MPSADFQPLTVEVEQSPSGHVVRATGEVDTLTAPRLRAEVDRLLPAPDGVLVVDLTGVTFLSSAGLSVLVSAHQQAERSGGQVRIVAGHSTTRVFEITGLAHTLRLHDSLESAQA